MHVNIFGKHDCGKCASTKKMLGYFIPKWGMADRVKVEFHDLDTRDGLAEGAFHDVADRLPTVIVTKDDKTLARWEGKVPEVDEVRIILQGPGA
jgi:hypothetical protein